MSRQSSKTKLSSNVLDMKFMKKSKERFQLEAEEDERKILFNSQIPDAMIKGGDQCLLEPSFVPCESLLFGRFSFKGKNPEIEKLMQENDRKDMNKFKQMDGVSNKEMAHRYSTLIDNMGKKFVPKRKRDTQDSYENNLPRVSNKKSMKFQKPSEDCI